MLSYIRRLRRPAASTRRPDRCRLVLETLEDRLVPSSATINVAQPGRVLTDHLLGINTPGWDAYLNNNPGDSATSTPDAKTVQKIKDAGLKLLRLSDGTGADEWHFNQENSNTFAGSAALWGKLVDAAGAAGLTTINYGTGTPEEGAAYVAYLEGNANDNTPIAGWGTVGSWATLRGQNPLGNGDGLDFLRGGHAAPYNIHYFEIGNEVYFDLWGKNLPGARATADPAEYAKFTADFAALAKQIDPQAQIGVDLGNPKEFDNWNNGVISAASGMNYKPDFVSDHLYLSDVSQNDGVLSDQDLLLHTVSDPNSVLANHSNAPGNWATRDADFRTLLQGAYGNQASSIDLFVTEFNSDASSASAQSYGLPHALFLADAVGSILSTDYTALTPWDLRTDGPLLGTNANAYTPYPAYFAMQLSSHLVHTGDQVLPASSDNPYLSVYATTRPDGTVEVMLINKSNAQDDNVSFDVNGFTPAGTAKSWQYGQAGGNALAENDNVALGVNIGADGLAHFQFSVPAYSMTVLELTPDGGQQDNGPGLIQAATADHPVVTGNQVGLSIMGVSAHGEQTLTYTWTKTAGPDGVTFSVNGSNAAKNTTATFSQPGTYTFQATVTDVNGKTVTSSVNVTVDQAPAFTSSGSTTFTVGTPGTFPVTASGFPAATVTESAADVLPAGVKFDAATGTLSGTPAAGSDGTYTLHFTASNGIAGDASQTFTLTVATAAVPQDSLSQLQHDHGFSFTGSYYQNYLGLNEKWFEDRDNQWYVVQPNGQLSRWNGGTSLTQIATVSPTVYANLELLFQAPVTLSAQAQAQLSQLEQADGFHFTGGYYQNWMGQNEKWLKDQNGTWFVLTTNGQLRPWTSAGLGNAVATVDPTVWDNPDLLFGAKLSQAVQGQLSQLRDQYGFHFTGDYYQSFLGLNAKWFQDRSGQWYALFNDGSLKSWSGPSDPAAAFTTVATLDSSVYADPQLLFQAPTLLSQPALTQLGQLEQANGFHFAGNYFQNFLGQNEKWLQDQNGAWFVLTTNGQLQPWTNAGLGNAIATVDPAVWDNPDLLFGA